ncbi:MAG: protein kinase [Planctomycetaceae bacterium]
MTDDKKKSPPLAPDTALEATVNNLSDSTDQDLAALVRQADSITDGPFDDEPACRDFVKRVTGLGAPQVAVREIGQYELLELLGRGGMGEVWKARQKKLNRIVAIKVLHPRISRDNDASARFEQEMRAVGALQHENIVQALDAGEVDGVPYLAMEHVDGRVLSDVLADSVKRGKRLSLAKACMVIRQAAIGLQFAHENGIVHRDIKPSNIMVTLKGRVKLLDMGLARLADTDTPMPELTAEGQVMGTLDYMPPEQLRDSRTAGVPADIYSLGATFYKLVTGRAPFANEKTNSVESKILAIASERPVPVSELREDLPTELSQLIDQMLRKDPGQRPASMNAVIARIAEISNSLAQPKPGSEPSVSASLQPQAPDVPPAWRNLKAWLIGASVIGLLLFGGILLTLKDPVHGDLVIEGPDGVTIKATRLDDPSDSRTFTAGEGESSLTEGSWKITIIGAGFDEFTLANDTVEIKGLEGATVRIRRRDPVAARPKGDSQPNAVTALPAKTNSSDKTNDTSGTDVREPRQLTDQQIHEHLKAVDWNHENSPAEMEGYAVTPPRIPGIATAWQILPTFAHHVGRNFLLSPTGTYSIAIHDDSNDPYLRVTERKTGSLVCCVEIGPRTGFSHQGIAFDFAPDERRFVTLSRNSAKSIGRIYDMRGLLTAKWESTTEFKAVKWSPDGQRIMLTGAAGSEQRTPAGKAVSSFVQPTTTGLHALTWSPSGKQFACIAGGKVLVFDADGNEPVVTLEGSDGLALHSCRWHPSGNKILTNGPAGPGAAPSALLWTLTGQNIRLSTQRLHEEFVGFSPDGKFLVTNYGDIRDQTNSAISQLDMSWVGYIQGQNVKLRWVDPGRLVFQSSNRGAGYSLEYAPSGKLLQEYDHPVPLPQHSATLRGESDVLSLGGTAMTGIWQFNWSEKKSTQITPPGSREWMGFAAFSPDGTSALQYSQSRLPVYSADGELQYETEADAQGLISWNRDGTLLAHGDRNGDTKKIRVWNRQTLVATFEGLHQEEIRGFAWAPDKDVLLVWDGALNVCVWEPRTPEKPVFRTKGHGFKYHPGNNHWSFDTTVPCWSPDGSLLAVPTEKSVRVFTPSGELKHEIAWKPEQIGPIWWRGNGQQLVAGTRMLSLDGTGLGALPNLRLLDFRWNADGTAIGSGHRFIAFWDKLGEKPSIITLAGFDYQTPKISMLSRGMNSQTLSPSGRHLLKQTGVTVSAPSSDRLGDISLIDVAKRTLKFTGLTFSDGARFAIQPKGQVICHEVKNTERYLTYMLRYENGRLLPLSPRQFVSRIGISRGHQFVQQVLDLGGSVSIQGRTQPLSAKDVPTAQALPALTEVHGVEITGASGFPVSDFSGLGELKSLRSLNLSRTGTTRGSMNELAELKELKVLNLAGIEISDGISTVLPASLEDLDVSNTPIGDFLLFDLAEFKSLKRLNVEGTKVTVQGVTALKNSLPHCNISH